MTTPGTTTATADASSDAGSLLPPLLELWAVVTLLALVVGGALGPALRGAVEGIDTWIHRVDEAAAYLSQISATLTFFLTVHAVLVSTQVLRPRILIGLLAPPAAIVVVLLVSAQRISLSYPSALVSAGCATIVLLVSTLLAAPTRPALRPALALAGLSLGSETLRVLLIRGGHELGFDGALGGLRWLFGIAALIVVLLFQYRGSRLGRFALPLALSAGLFSSLLSRAATFDEVSAPLLVLARTIRALLPEPAPHLPSGGAAFQLGLGVYLLLWTLWSRRTRRDEASLLALVGAMLALSITVASSQLMLSCAVLASIALVSLTRGSRELSSS